jgi:glycine dehydrogenase
VFNGNSRSPVFDEFTRRHLGADPSAQQTMLSALGYRTLDDLIDAAVPGQIRPVQALRLICSCLPPEAFAEIPREGAHA